MPDSHSRQRHVVNWRAALILPQNTTPLHGRAVEASEQVVILILPNEIKPGVECRVYLDILDPASGRDIYLDFRAAISTSSLIGQISQFRHVAQIIDIKPEQQAFLREMLKHLGH